MNPFTISYRFNGGNPTIQQVAGLPFTARCKSEYKLKIASLPLFIWEALRGRRCYTATAEIVLECDPELKAIIDRYTSEKARESINAGAGA